MTTKTKTYKNYIDLISLKASNLLKKQDFKIILNDDVWDNNILIVKSGGYLTDSIINKLINFGIKQVSVNFPEDVDKQDNANLLKIFISSQKALIVNNNLSETSWIKKNLLSYGIESTNIFITDDHNSINKFFRNQQINIIFINSSLYEKCQKCIDKYSLLKNTHVFVIMGENESARKLKNGYNSDAKFIARPLSAERLKLFANQALNRNFLDFYSQETRIS